MRDQRIEFCVCLWSEVPPKSSPSWHVRRLLRSRICRAAFLLDRGGFVQPAMLPSGEYFLPLSTMRTASISPAHTAGPWFLDEVEMTITADDSRRPICSVHFSDGNGHERQDLANGRLIAAAPMLLLKLRQYSNDCDTRIAILKEEAEELGFDVEREDDDWRDSDCRDILEQIHHWKATKDGVEALLGEIEGR